MITDLLGTPSLEDLSHVTSPTAVRNLLSKPKPPALHKFYALSHNITHEAAHMLSQMLVFNPVSCSPLALKCAPGFILTFVTSNGAAA